MVLCCDQFDPVKIGKYEPVVLVLVEYDTVLGYNWLNSLPRSWTPERIFSHYLRGW